MRLEKKREEELAKRKGLAGRTLVQFTWLLISAIIAYFIIRWLMSEEYITYNYLYRNLSIPRSVPEGVLLGGMILLFVIAMQFFLLIGYAIGSPAAREKTGRATAYSRNPDPFEEDYRR